MTYDKELNLLPINTQLFALDYIYSNTIVGSYSKGAFPINRTISINVVCKKGTDCRVHPAPLEEYIFNGISTSPSTFSPYTSAFNFRSYIRRVNSSSDALPWSYYYVMPQEKTDLINQLPAGTYYVWIDGALQGALTISDAKFRAFTDTKKAFVITNKLGNNPIIASLDWENPTSQPVYLYYALSSRLSPDSSDDIVHGTYGPLTCAALSNGTFPSISIQYDNVKILGDGDWMYLTSYKTSNKLWNLKSSGFNSTTKAAIYGTDSVRVRNFEFRFSGPESPSLNVAWGDSITFPIPPGYSSINWSNNRLGQANFRGGTTYSTTTQTNIRTVLNGITNYIYWFDMTAYDSAPMSYSINQISSLPSNSGMNTTVWTHSTGYQINQWHTKNIIIPIPQAHYAAVSSSKEYTHNGYSIVRSGTKGGDDPTISGSNIVIPRNSFGNITVTAQWDFAKNSMTGKLSAINSGDHVDLSGATKAFDGYTYNFYESSHPSNATSSVSFTSHTRGVPKSGVFKAQTKAGYEFITPSIINYPFDSDGSISSQPYDNLFTLNSNSFNTSIPEPLRGNMGITTYDYRISQLMSGNINVGVSTRKFEYPIFVSMGANVTSFRFNYQWYDTTWADKYYYSGKTYYRLSDATFNISSSKTYEIDTIRTEEGFYSPSYTHTIVIDKPSTNASITSTAFVNLPDAKLREYAISIVRGTGISHASISPTTYNIYTTTFTPSAVATPTFGYDNVKISGLAQNTISSKQYILSGVVSVPRPSQNSYGYVATASKIVSRISKAASTPYGINSYTFNKTSFEISSDKQSVSVTYKMNNGYAMNTSSVPTITNFQNITGDVVAQDVTYNGFNIPANSIGNVVFTPPTPQPITYSIKSGSLQGIAGINSFTISPNNYTISNSSVKQTISTITEVLPGYSRSTSPLTVAGAFVSNVSNSSFNINQNAFGNIVVVPGAPTPNIYTISISPINIPGRNTSGISEIRIARNNYNVTSPNFTPGVNYITYINNGFSGYESNIYNITVGSTENITFGAYANVVDFNIQINTSTGINSYEYSGNVISISGVNVDTYNVFTPDKTIYANNIVVTNQLYSGMGNTSIGSIPTGSTGHKGFSLSPSLKINSIQVTTPIPKGYSSVTTTPSTYTATKDAAAKVQVSYTMSPGYLSSTDNLTVSKVKNETGADVDVTSVTNSSFTIPLSSWGDISVAVGTPTVINYQVDFPSKAPSGVHSIDISPPNYTAGDEYPRTFTLRIEALAGYHDPSWILNSSPKSFSSLTFSMPTFSTTPPSVRISGGNPITYNMNIVKGEGISGYSYKSSIYSDSSTVDTYNILTAKTVVINNITTSSHLWQPVANFTPFSVAVGSIGNLSHTISTQLRTSTIKVGDLPVGISSMSTSIDNYQARDTGLNRPVVVSYTMNNGYQLASSYNTPSITGAMDERAITKSISPTNSTHFNIPSNTWGDLTVTAANPVKSTYTLEAGTLPDGMASMSFSMSSTTVSTYQVSNLDREVIITYVMNPGYAQPTSNPIVTSPGVVINHNTFSIPSDHVGNITVTPNTISDIPYDIVSGTIPTGINSMIIAPDSYVINHTKSIPVTVEFNLDPGWSAPSGSLSIIGSSVNSITSNYFSIRPNGFGDITVTPAAPIVNVYNVSITKNPKPAAISSWSVSPSNYRVTDFTSLSPSLAFSVTATGNTGYESPTWSINGNINSASSFTMASFTETVPTLQITAGDPIPYNIGLNISSINSGITAASISPITYNIESANFRPTVSGVSYADGYSGYTSSPSLSSWINKGSYGDRTYVLMGTPITYNINVIPLGAGINSATISQINYNIQQTPINLSWSNVTYKPGYNGFVTTGSLNLPAGTFGDKSLTITGNKIVYNITINKPVLSGVNTFKYSGNTYNSLSQIIDNYTVTSADKSIILSDLTYQTGYRGPNIVNFDVITTGSIGDKSYDLSDVYDLYIDANKHPEGLIDNRKIVSFDYNGTTYTVDPNNTILVDYFFTGKSIPEVTITSVIYEDGYSGPTSYTFAAINANVVKNDVVYELNSTILESYDISIEKPAHVVSFTYGGPSSYNVLSSDIDVIVTDVVYDAGYEGEDSFNLYTITSGSTGHVPLTIPSPIEITYFVKVTKPSTVISFTYNNNTYTSAVSQIDEFTVTSPNKTISLSNVTYPPGYLGDSNMTLGTINTGTAKSESYTIPSPTLEDYEIVIIKPYVSGIISFDYNGTTFNGVNSKIDEFWVTSEDKVILLTNIVYAEGHTGSTTIELGTVTSGTIGDVQYELSIINNVYVDVSTYPEPSTNNQKITSFKYNDITFNVNGRSSVWIDYFVDGADPIPVSITDIVYQPGYKGPTEYDFGIINPSIVEDEVIFTTDLTTLETYYIAVDKPANVVSFVYSGPTSFTVITPNIEILVTDVVYATGYQGDENIILGTVTVGTSQNVYFELPDPTLIPYSITINKPANVVSFTYAGPLTYTITSPDIDVNVTNIVYAAGYEGIGYQSFGTIASGNHVHKVFDITAPTLITYKIVIDKPLEAGVISFDYNNTTWDGPTQEIDSYTIIDDDKNIVLTNIIYADGYVGSDTVDFGTIMTGSYGDFTRALGDVHNVFIDVDKWSNDSTTHYKIKSFKYNNTLINVNGRSRIWVNYFVSSTPNFNNNVSDITYEPGYTGPETYAFGTITPALLNDDVVYTASNTTLITYRAYLKKDSTIVSFKYRNGFLGTNALVTVTNNNLITVEFNIQSRIKVEAIDIVYATGYEGYNNGPTANPTYILYDETNFDRSEDIGTSTIPILVTYDKLTNYTITLNKQDPSGKLVSFDEEIVYVDDQLDVTNNLYTILSKNISISAKNMSYVTATNADGTWYLYTGPETYNAQSGWIIETGTTGNKVFTIPVDNITQPNVFTITYNGKSKTANGYTSEITSLKNSYVYKTGIVITKGNTASFNVVNNEVLPAISQRLAAGNPIHYDYTLSSTSAGITVNENGTVATISNSDFGNKVIDISWSQIIFSVSIRDHYIIRDVYRLLRDKTKPSPISNLPTDETVFVVEYSLDSENQNKRITNKIYGKVNIIRTGWDFVNAKEINGEGTLDIVGTPGTVDGFTIPAGWYDDRVARLVYTPKTYTITLGENNSLWIIYDHGIQKWSPENVPLESDKIFNGYIDGNGVKRISYGGIYDFSNDTYTNDVTFYPDWTDRNDYIKYDATENISIGSEYLQTIPFNGANYNQIYEQYISPTLVQNILLSDSISVSNTSPNTKYVYDLSNENENIKFRRILSPSILKGYNTLSIVSSDLYNYLNVPNTVESGMVKDTSELLSRIRNSWSTGVNGADLLNLNISDVTDLWNNMEYASSDLFRILFKVSSSTMGPFSYWVLQGMIKPSEISNIKVNTAIKQDMFLMVANSELKEVMTILDKNNNEIYDRSPNVLSNNTILTNWEGVVSTGAKPASIYGLLPVNKDKVYSMYISMKTSWKSESQTWLSGFTNAVLNYSSNIRTGNIEDTVNITNYSNLPIRSIYSSKIDGLGSLTLNSVKNYSIVGGKLVVSGIDSILGAMASEKGALSSDGEFYIPTLYYNLSINNTKSSSLRTKVLNPAAKRYVFTPRNRNIGKYVVQGPVSDQNNSLRFLLSETDGITSVYIGKLNTDLNKITSLIPLTRELATNWYVLSNPFNSLTSGNDYYTIVIEKEDRYMYNNLLVYRRFKS